MADIFIDDRFSILYSPYLLAITYLPFYYILDFTDALFCKKIHYYTLFGYLKLEIFLFKKVKNLLQKLFLLIRCFSELSRN